MSEELTFEALKKRKKPAMKSAYICLDPEVANRLEEAKKRLAAVKKAVEISPEPLKPQREKELKQVAKAYDQAMAAFEAEIVEFKFRSIGRKRLDELVTEHPPTPENLEDARKEGVEIAFNPMTFAPALISLASVSPKLSPEQAQEIWDDEDWSQADLQTLYATAMNVNQVFIDVSKLKKD